MPRKTLIAIAVVIVLALAILPSLVWIRSTAPKAARLLPSAEVFFYADFRPLRAANLTHALPAVEHDPEYDEFVRATGFQFERDLDELALAAHRKTSDAGETRYSEVFVARFDRGKLAAYLKKLSQGVERYRNLDIYAIALPGRTLRVAILNDHTVAASNTEGPYVIHQIVDRYSAMPFSTDAPELLRRYYGRVPLGSLVWMIAQLSPPGSGGNQQVHLPGGYDFFIPGDTAVVGSLRYAGAVQFKLQALNENEADAKRLGDQLSAFLALFRSIESGAQAPGGDPDVQGFFDSLKVERDGTRTTLSASIPPGFVKKVFGNAE